MEDKPKAHEVTYSRAEKKNEVEEAPKPKKKKNQGEE